jgi:hypothetical protein
VGKLEDKPIKCSKCKKVVKGEIYYTEAKKPKAMCEKCWEEYCENVLDWNDLYETIKNYFYLDKLPISTITLLKKWYSEDGLTFYGMRMTFEYMAYIKEIDFNKGETLVGLIPYYYSETSEFHQEVEEINKFNCACGEDEEVEIVIKSKLKTKEQKKDININSLLLSEVFEDEEE